MTERVPDPARPSRWTRASWRRAYFAVLAAVLVTLAIVGVVLAWGPSRDAGFGPTVRVHARVPVARWLPLFRRHVTALIGAAPDSVWVSFPEEAVPLTESYVIPGECGCRFEPQWSSRMLGVTVLEWRAWPRRDAVIRILSVPGGEAAFVLPNPRTIPPLVTQRPLLPLPWSGDIGGARVSFRSTRSRTGMDEVRLAIEYERTPGRSPATDVELRDALGNRYYHRSGPPGIVVPFGSGICPHTEWWEAEIRSYPGDPVVLRFAPPRTSR